MIVLNGAMTQVSICIRYIEKAIPVRRDNKSAF